MSFLSLLWTAAEVLAGLALGWAWVLVAQKAVRNRWAEARARRRKAAISVLAACLAQQDPPAEALRDVLRRPRLLAETLLQFTATVRGEGGERVLAYLKAAGVAQALHRGLASRTQATRLACVEALAAFPEALPAGGLEGALRRPSLELRVGAARTMVLSGVELRIGRVLDLMIGGELPVSGQIAALLGSLTGRAPADTLAALRRSDLTTAVRAMLLEALGEAGAYAALPALIAAAGDAEPEVRASAIRALGDLKHPAAAAAFACALEDESAEVRAAAASAIATTDLISLGDALVARLGDPVWAVRFAAGEALASLGDRGVSRLREIAAAMHGDAAAEAAGSTLAEHRAA